LPHHAASSSTFLGTKKRRKRRRLPPDEPETDDTNALTRLGDVWENVHVLATTNTEEDERSTYYPIDEDTPYNRHKLRSEMVRKRFADPVWKSAWYERRWGDHRKRSEKEKNERLLHKRVLPLARLLSHPALAAMNEDEIAQAIWTYRNANRQRSANVRLAVERRRNDFDFPAGIEFSINTTTVARNSLFSFDTQDLDSGQARGGEQKSLRDASPARASSERKAAHGRLYDPSDRGKTTPHCFATY
jgi:hypothetical protein